MSVVSTSSSKKPHRPAHLEVKGFCKWEQRESQAINYEQCCQWLDTLQGMLTPEDAQCFDWNLAKLRSKKVLICKLILPFINTKVPNADKCYALRDVVEIGKRELAYQWKELQYHYSVSRVEATLQ